jgi:hypothetical protein
MNNNQTDSIQEAWSFIYDFLRMPLTATWLSLDSITSHIDSLPSFIREFT